MIDNISLDSLKIFYEVANQKNITQASRVLYISQPAITQSINKLEDQLNTKLFVRHSKGVELTYVGGLVYNKVVQALGSINQIDKILEQESNFLQGQLVIGCGTTLAKELLVQSLVSFMTKYPHITVKIKDITYDEMLFGLQTGQLDLCLVQQNQKEQTYTFKKAFETNYVLVAGEGLSVPNIKTFDQLNNYTFVAQDIESHSRQVFNKFLNEYAVVPKQLHEVSGYNLVKELCVLGVGLGFIPEYLVKKEIESGKLKTVSLPSELYGIKYGYLYNENFLNKIGQEFLKFLP